MDLWPPFTCDSLSHPGFVIVGTLTGGPAQDIKARGGDAQERGEGNNQENLQSKKAKKAEPNDEAEDESEEEEE